MSALCAKGPRFNPGPGKVFICILPNAAFAAAASAEYAVLISAVVNPALLFSYGQSTSLQCYSV